MKCQKLSQIQRGNISKSWCRSNALAPIFIIAEYAQEDIYWFQIDEYTHGPNAILPRKIVIMHLETAWYKMGRLAMNLALKLLVSMRVSSSIKWANWINQKIQELNDPYISFRELLAQQKLAEKPIKRNSNCKKKRAKLFQKLIRKSIFGGR